MISHNQLSQETWVPKSWYRPWLFLPTYRVSVLLSAGCLSGAHEMLLCDSAKHSEAASERRTNQKVSAHSLVTGGLAQ